MKCLTEKADWCGDYESSDVARRFDALEAFYQTDNNTREMWDDVLLPLLRGKGARTAVEIGSAPGQNLIELAKGLGVTPTGIEYTEEGAELNRRLFARNGFDPKNVICEDFFSPTLDRLLGTFDIAASFGFVEHFDDTVAVVQRQLAFCQPGGYLIVTIPNLSGVYEWWNRAFNPRVIETHNMALMRPGVFFGICDGVADLEIITKAQCGAFEHGLLTHRGQIVARAGIKLLRATAPALQAVDRTLLAGRGISHAPYLVIVARRRG